MKKKILAILCLSLLFTGCGKLSADNSSTVDRTYQAQTLTKPTDIPGSSSTSVTEPVNNSGGSSSNIDTGSDIFAYKINGTIMDLDSKNGPYTIIDIDKMEILDCTSKNARIVKYSYDGPILTLTLTSDENPDEETYRIDTSVKSQGTLPVS